MTDIYQLGCVHRQQFADEHNLTSSMSTPTGRYTGPLYRTGPSGSRIFAHEDHEASFQRVYLSQHGVAHTDPCGPASSSPSP